MSRVESRRTFHSFKLPYSLSPSYSESGRHNDVDQAVHSDKQGYYPEKQLPENRYY